MIRNDVIDAFLQVLPVQNPEDIVLLTPKHEHFGDYAVNVMQLDPKPDQKTRNQFVDELSNNPLFQNVKLQGAFINVFIHPNRLAQEVVRMIENENTYGSSDWGSGKKWLIEHTSPNPNKAMHLGHLRNNVTGMALARISAFAGVDVVTDAVDNDRGIAIARLMWGYIKYGHKMGEDHDIEYWYENQNQWHTPESASKHPGKFVDELYVQASNAFKTDEDVQERVREMVVQWENKDPKIRALWQTVLEYSHEGQRQTLARLDNHRDHVWHEHEHYEQGKKYVEKGLKEGIFKKTDEGTVITQLEDDYSIPETVVLKSDGTSLYITQDIALTDLKVQKFHPDKLMWVVGPEQELAMRQMFAVCEQLDILENDQAEHVTYGFMSLKGVGKMSSRKGTVVYIDELLDESIERAAGLIKDKNNINVENVSQTVGIGAVKYSLLKVSRNQNIAFDYEESLSFEGNSGPYIQYVYARMHSLLSKGKGHAVAETQATDLDIDIFTDEDRALMRILQRFPEVVLEAAQGYAPHLIAGYLFSVAQTFNALYESQTILSDDPKEAAARLALVKATSIVIKNGLGLLGVGVVDKM